MQQCGAQNDGLFDGSAGRWCNAALHVGGLLAVAFVDDGSGTFFAPAALGGHTQIELDFIEGAASVRLGGDDLVGDSVADANNHGL